MEKFLFFQILLLASIGNPLQLKEISRGELICSFITGIWTWAPRLCYHKVGCSLGPSLILFHQSHLLMWQMTSFMCPQKMTLKSPRLRHFCGLAVQRDGFISLHMHNQISVPLSPP